MKILKIELENINCLAGKWAIDFTDPSYAEQGHNLFVIHGNTGSGKSSILDAVTLALYGATPRQGYVYKSIAGNAVMTADTGSCFARVTYQCVKGTFVSQWSQHRAGNRANGNLQDAEGVVWGAVVDQDQLIAVARHCLHRGFELVRDAADRVCRAVAGDHKGYKRHVTHPPRQASP